MLTQQSWTPALCMDMVWTLTLTFDLKGSPCGRLSPADPVLTDVCKCCCEWSQVLSLWGVKSVSHVATAVSPLPAAQECAASRPHVRPDPA